MNKELTKEEAEEYYNKLWLENKELIQDNMNKLSMERFELELELVDKDKEIERLHSIIKEVRDNLENSIKSINEKLKNNKEPFEVIDGKIQYINDYRVVRLKAFRTKCKELLEILDKEKE